MTDVATTVSALIKVVQLALQVIYSLAISAWRYPATSTIVNATFYDFIILGGGSAGCILANRLSANSSQSVLLIEAGGYAPIESDMPGMFTVLPNSVFDYNITSVNDNKTAQNLENNCVGLTAAKMLGGGSAIDHMIHVVGDPHDFNNWASIVNDSSWNYTNIQQYMTKQENLTDSVLLNSSYCNLHGTKGNIKIARQPSSDNDRIIAAAQELGHKYVLDTTSATSTLGITQPLMHIGDQMRQSNANTYLSAAKSRSNLYLVLNTTAKKILFNGTTAIGVEVVDSSGNVYVVYANKEVIVSAGALNSPKLLMLSGVGPAEHLESHGIDVVADLPVGKNFKDHMSAVVAYQMENDTSTTPASDPFQFPVPTTCLYGAFNSSQTYPDYQAIILIFPHDSTAQVQLCKQCFKYSDDICNKWYTASVGRTTLFVVVNVLLPESCGKVELASANYTDNPVVTTGTYTDSNGSDLAVMTQALAAFDNFTTTTAFKEVNATFVDLGFCSNYTGNEYWECYAMATSATMWHYTGTCKMGVVVDPKLQVINTTGLRVIDASVMPTEVSGNIRATVNMIAEHGASMILDHWNITSTST